MLTAACIAFVLSQRELNLDPGPGVADDDYSHEMQYHHRYRVPARFFVSGGKVSVESGRYKFGLQVDQMAPESGDYVDVDLGLNPFKHFKLSEMGAVQALLRIKVKGAWIIGRYFLPNPVYNVSKIQVNGIEDNTLFSITGSPAGAPPQVLALVVKPKGDVPPGAPILEVKPLPLPDYHIPGP
jgi:hypothetical protein